MKLLQLPFSRGGGASIELEGVRIRNVRPAKRLRAGIATNKAGRVVLTGDGPSGPVKIFEAMSPEHAEFIHQYSGVSLDGYSFPPVIARCEQLLVCEWVSGKSLSHMSLGASVLEGLARAQAKLHDLGISGSSRPGFDYWEDIIAPRFLRASALLGKTEFARVAISKVRDWRIGVGPTLNHPDVSPANVIAVDDGYVIIDNELLYAGAGAFMDVLNTMRSLPEASRSTYLASYRRQAGGVRFPEHDVLHAFWLAREAGAAFVAARVDRVAKLLSDPRMEEDRILALLKDSK